jgi:signal transduction histidine kinase
VELHSSGHTKFKGGGPGLGLAIAAGIVKSHGGSMWVESPGYDEERLPGSTFIIRIPVAQ